MLRAQWPLRALAALAVVAAPCARADDGGAAQAPLAPPAGSGGEAGPPGELTVGERRAGANVAGAPFARYAPETRWGMGGGALAWFHADAAARGTGRVSSAGVAFQLTQRGQSCAGAQADLWLARGTWHATAVALAERWPYDLWPVGAAAGAASEPYTPRTARADLAVARLAVDGGGGGTGLWVGARAAARSDRIVDAAPGGLVDRCAVAGCRGGRAVLVQATAAWDTRDHVFTVERGVLVAARAGGAAPALGSSSAWAEAELDARAWVPAPGRRATLALQARLQTTAGAVPFYLLPTFGGDRALRGVLDGRYRDATSLLVQAEWAIPLAWRLGLELFAGAGQVAPRPAALGAARVVPAAGAGLRLVVDPVDRVFVRLDHGVAPGSSQWYLAFGQAI